MVCVRVRPLLLFVLPIIVVAAVAVSAGTVVCETGAKLEEKPSDTDGSCPSQEQQQKQGEEFRDNNDGNEKKRRLLKEQQRLSKNSNDNSSSNHTTTAALSPSSDILSEKKQQRRRKGGALFGGDVHVRIEEDRRGRALALIRYGEPQVVDTGNPVRAAETRERLHQVDKYMHRTVYSGRDDDDDDDGDHDDDAKQRRQRQRDMRSWCLNRNELCTYLAVLGECDGSPAYMLSHCAPACMACDRVDMDAAGGLLPAEDRELGTVAIPYGVPQKVTSLASGNAQETRARLHSVHEYMERTVFEDRELREVAHECRNKNELCTYWAATGECSKNPSYMNADCAPACFSCDSLVFEKRCGFDRSAAGAWDKPGDLDATFTRIATHPYYQQYGPKILQQPSTGGGPWVVTLDAFLTEEECQTLIDLGEERGYRQSTEVGSKRADGTYSTGTNVLSRSSTNAWCDVGTCYKHPVVRRVISKLENLTGIPDSHGEYLQLLRYEKGQFYKTHHDFIDHQVDREPGPRILTVFLYLNTVDAGGGTQFPQLNNLTVLPDTLGKALLWPSVLNDDPFARDDRTAHQALPVEAGIKYGANAWIHQREFKKAHHKNCV